MIPKVTLVGKIQKTPVGGEIPILGFRLVAQDLQIKHIFKNADSNHKP